MNETSGIRLPDGSLDSDRGLDNQSFNIDDAVSNKIINEAHSSHNVGFPADSDEE